MESSRARLTRSSPVGSGCFEQFLDKDREAWAEVEFAEVLDAEALHSDRTG
jgi:hypothetical protein